jgi:hypothetical protein
MVIVPVPFGRLYHILKLRVSYLRIAVFPLADKVLLLQW